MMLMKSNTASNDNSDLVGFCQVARQAVGTNRVIAIKEAAEEVPTPGACLPVESVKAPYPVYSVPLFTTHSRKEFSKCPIEKAGMATAAHIPISKLNRVHPTLPLTALAGKVFRTFFLTIAQISPTGRGTLSTLLEKTAQAVPSNVKWQVMLMGFSRQGRTQLAIDLAGEITSQVVEGDHWQIVDVQLVDLAKIDNEFIRWAAS
jgi:hypothetical protein